MIETLKENQGGLCSDIILMYICGWNISEICKILDISRFKVKRQLDNGLSLIKKMVEEERP